VLNATFQTQLAMENDPRLGMFTSILANGISVGKFYARVDGMPLPPSGFAAFDALTPVATIIPPTNGTLSDFAAALSAQPIQAR